MSFPVIKGAGYALVHTSDIIIHNGTTQTTEKLTNPNSEYLKKLPEHIRDFDKVLKYIPNQVYIGNMKPENLRDYEMPWHDKEATVQERFGKYGEIMPQDEFIGLMKLADAFDLVLLEKEFTQAIKEKLSNHPLFKEDANTLKEGVELEVINKAMSEHAEGLYQDGQLIGCVKKAHDVDVNLTAHILFENLVVKASGVLAFNNLLAKNNITADEIDYVIECSEEACGDMNQRGGGNFAKSIAEQCNAVNATGSDCQATL